ncbi:MAG: leucine-rich repeat protein [Clostridia bacterium]|nr:leucine-rich repeat protein [Clostridia bacterium]
MKRATLLIIALLVLTTIWAALPSCSARKNKVSEGDSTPPTFSEEDTEQGTQELPVYLSPEESSETESETITEQPTEEETEIVTVPVETLRFTSYGNGTCAVTGIGSCTDLFIVIPERSPAGDIVTSIDDKAFYGNREIKAIEIPSTVSYIGSKAFADCASLVYISVDYYNKSFTDDGGVLYSKDGSVLLAYPSACGATELTISKSVIKIADMAFYGCDTLKVINYEGTLSDWGEIELGEMNYGLFTASVNCNAEK